MLVSRSLKENTSDTPKKISNTKIEFTKVEKWEVSKSSLLEQKTTIEADIAVKQIQIDEIDVLLLMFDRSD